MITLWLQFTVLLFGVTSQVGLCIFHLMKLWSSAARVTIGGGSSMCTCPLTCSLPSPAAKNFSLVSLWGCGDGRRNSVCSVSLKGLGLTLQLTMGEPKVEKALWEASWLLRLTQLS